MPNETLKRILCVEDEADIQAIVRIALEAVGGFELMVCGSGHDALRDAPTYEPDLILLDVMMPKLDGPATLVELRKQPSLKNTPIVFMTAKVQTHEVEQYRKMGAADVIAKPFDPMTLSDTLRGIWNNVP
ncbi:response regulator [Dyella sp. M7H15-1]|uniref:response regulator n=1 Tax=Dyella sp. M7H15-1 TaxID=2501295 RepID=UPI001004F35B|nr:response regulator [Dyella sp. M7H15-1]QAU23546.1 response regulator [Dyella sp. M7H15-1]